MTVRILHTADLHLGATHVAFGDYAAARSEHFLATFDRLVDRAASGRADIFVVAGDLFDRNNVPGSVIERARAGFGRLSAAGIASVIVPGTHDCIEGPASILKTVEFPGAIVLSDPRCESPAPIVVRGERVNLYGLAARPGDENPLPSMRRRDLPGLHLGMLHATLAKAPQWEIRTRDVPVTPDSLAELGLDYIALGHLHQAQTIEAGGRLVAAYPGSPEGRDFTETGARQALWVELGPMSADISAERCETKQLAAVDLDLTDISTIDAAVDAMVALCGEAAIARVRLTGAPTADLNLSAIEERASARLDYLEIVDDMLALPHDQIALLGHERTVRGAFVRRALERMERATDQGERDLLATACRIALVEFSRRSAG